MRYMTFKGTTFSLETTCFFLAERRLTEKQADRGAWRYPTAAFPSLLCRRFLRAFEWCSPRSATLKLPKRGGNGASQPPPSPLSFFRPHTYPKGTQRVPKGLPKGDYFSSSQSSSVIKKDGGFNNTNERRSRGRH